MFVEEGQSRLLLSHSDEFLGAFEHIFGLAVRRRRHDGQPPLMDPWLLKVMLLMLESAKRLCEVYR